MADRWTSEWQGLRLRVEQREFGANGGPTLHVAAGDADRVWLRFDCFREGPHWHLDPGGRDEVQPLDAAADPVTACLEKLRGELPELLARAGAPDALHAPLAEALASEAGRGLLRDVERALRHRPAVLEELDPRLLEQRRSEKWHTYPPDVLPAWVAEMDFPVAAPIEDELRRFLDRSDLGYPIAPRETGLAEVFRDRMQERFDWSPDPANVEILSEVVQGLYVALLAFASEGDGVVVQTPIYPPFLQAVKETGRRLVENRLLADGPRLEIDFDALDRDLDDRTRMLMLCHPHNPSGRVFDRGELEQLAQRVLDHDLVVVSDEIHGDLVFDGLRHVPFASLGPEIAERTVTLTSPSKAFNLPGLRCAIAHFGSEALRRRFGAALPRHVRGGLGLLGLYASMAAWRLGQPWLDEVLPYLAANRDFARSALRERIPEIRFFTPEATYLAWLDCSGLELPGSPAAHFLRQGRVALADGRVFGAGWEAYARLNFATSRPILTEVLDRMAKALDR